jgi:hypothetical protein
MPALDAILTAVNPTLPGGSESPASPARPQNGEAFDRVMRRALAPEKTETSGGKNETEVKADGAGDTEKPADEKHKTGGVSHRRRIHHAHAKAAADENVNAGGTSEIAHHAAHPPHVAMDFSGGVLSGSAERHENRRHHAEDFSGSAPAVAALPANTFPSTRAIGKKSFTVNEKAVASAPAAAPEAGRSVTAKPETAQHRASADLVSALKPEATPQKTSSAPADDKIADNKISAPDAAKPENAETDNSPANPAGLKPADFSAEPVSAAPAPISEASEAVTISKPDAAQGEFPAVVDKSVKNPVSAPPETDGTHAAKMSMTMNKTEKTTKVAGANEKVLPGNAVAAAKENILPTARQGQSPVFIGAPAVNADAADSAGDISTGSMAALHTRALERTQDMVALQATRLVESKADSLQVVIKPGAGMQMSLELRQRGDAIEARAVLEHGDFTALNHHWPELQQRLEQRGIRLAPLTGGENFVADGGGQQFRQSPRDFAAQDLETGAFAEFALAQSGFHPAITAPLSAAPARGWESWA